MMKRKSKNIIRLSSILLLSFLFSMQAFGQTIDSTKISAETELNFAKTEKRGIKTNDGLIYLVASDNQTLIAFDSNKEIKWKVNIIEKCGVPAVGKSEIRYIKLSGSIIEIVFGKHDFANVELSSGKVNYLGAD